MMVEARALPRAFGGSLSPCERVGAVLVGLAFFVAASAATAQQPPTRCVVNDPTTTPLNLRASPNGAIIGQLANGQTVRILEQTVDQRGRSWARITVTVGMAAGREGWVFREFIACF